MRTKVAGLSLIAGLIIVALISFLPLLSESSKEFLVNIGNDHFPFTVQNIMWVVFAIGLGELFVRWQDTKLDQTQLTSRLLPEDRETVLLEEDLSAIYVRADEMNENTFLPRMIKRVITQIRVSGSMEQATTLLTSSIEFFIHEIDLRYNMLRYVMWFIPTLGFIGTVIGISGALAVVANSPDSNNIALDKVIGALGVAFYTTLLALLMAGILVFLLHVVQGKEEETLNKTGQYCMDNLINRLFLGD